MVAPLEPDASPVRATEIDGMPVFCGASRDRFGAGVEFGVGRCDERFVRTGISRIVQRIATAESSLRVDTGVDVRVGTTGLWGRGRDPSTVLAALNDMLSRLHTASEATAAAACETLRNANSPTDVGVAELAMSLRFGAKGPGLVSIEDYGLRIIRPQDVIDWIGRWFVRENATLWVEGEAPATMAIELPSGPFVERPAPMANDRVALPCLFSALHRGNVAVAFTAPSGPALEVGVEALEGRVPGMISRVDLLPGGVAHVTLSTECVAGDETAVVDRMVRVVEDAARYGPSEADVTDALERRRRVRDRADAPSCAMLRAAGVSRPDAEPDVTEISAALRPASTSLVVMVPVGTEVAIANLAPYPMTSKRRVDGPVILPARRRRRNETPQALIVAPEGVSRVEGDDTTTVTFVDLAGVLAWSNGQRVLWGEDDFRVVVFPHEWKNGGAAVAAIDAAVPKSLVIPMDSGRTVNDASVSTVAEGRVKRNALTRDALDSLGGYLRGDESVVGMVRADHERRAGVMAVTTARLLWIHHDRLEQQIPLDELQGIDLRMRYGVPHVVVRAADDEVEFTSNSVRAVQDFVVEVHGAVTRYVGPAKP